MKFTVKGLQRLKGMGYINLVVPVPLSEEEEINKISPNESIEKLLWLYYDSQTMIADAIFNKYKLNDVIRTYAVERHYSIWEKISSWSNSDKTESELVALKIIIDGSLKELSGSQINPQFVIEKLVKIL